MLFVNGCAAYMAVELFYGYHFTNHLYFFMYPDRALFIGFIAGLSGMYCGGLLFFNKVKMGLVLGLQAILVLVYLFLLMLPDFMM